MDVEAGPPGNHGDNPNAPASGGNYDPQYVAVVHLRSDGWNVSAIHAHFAATGLDAAARVDLASRLMLGKLQDGAQSFVYKGAPELPYVMKDGQYAQYLNFEKFPFGSQQDIYFFFEHAPGDLSFPQGDIATISRQFRNGKSADANHAFYATRDVTSQLPPELSALGSMVLMENHFTKKGNVKIDKKTESFTYKICLNYISGSGIPMVIDPDGNNNDNDP